MENEKSILVIDDDQTIREVLQDFLQGLGFRVLLAADGLEGMEKINELSYDLVILDIRMPYISGIGLIALIRDNKPGTPIICITGYGSSPENIAIEKKVDLTFSKPFNLKEMAQGIDKLLTKA